MPTLNETHDIALRSWVESANEAGCDFPIQNLPFGVFRRKGSNEDFRGGVAIGTEILDLKAASNVGAFSGIAARAAVQCANAHLNSFFAMGPQAWSALRLALSHALKEGSAHADKLRACMIEQAEAEYSVPVQVGDFTDFYASVYHATNVGKLFRPDNPLLPNYKWLPIAYHGRASSIRVSGGDFHRPIGQIMAPNAQSPQLGPCKRLDYEFEIGIYIGGGNTLGKRIAMADAEQHVFGLCLLNDWSARDVQAWEYQPLGPFLAKSFATTVSPWIVTLEALAPYRMAWIRPEEDPQPLPYLDSPENRAQGAIDIRLDALLETQKMRSVSQSPAALSRTSFKHAYWTLAQMVTHHTVNGCDLNVGDLFGSGTQSGPTETEQGSLLELSQGGKQPLKLPSGETRTFLEDGDRVIFRGWCEREGHPRVGFGECSATVLPALP